MPIHGLTDQPEGFFKIGQIRKGDKKTVEKTDPQTGKKKEVEVPVDLDYFRVTFMPGKKARELEAAFRAAYGDRPTELNIRFAQPEAGKIWDANFECYKQGGMIAKAWTDDDNRLHWVYYCDPSNDEVLVNGSRAIGEAGRAFMDKPFSLETPIFHNSKNEPQYLEPVGRLQVVIRELAGLEVGYFEFRPESWRDIANIDRELKNYVKIAAQFGRTICGIPFQLIRREEEVPARVNGKKVRKKSWVCHLKAEGSWGEKAMAMIERLALPDIVEGEVTEVTEGPEWDAGFDEPPVPETPQIPAKVPTETIKVTPPAPTTPALPHSREALMKIFSDEFNAASKKKIDLSAIPHINPKMTPEQITEAIQGLRAAVAAAGA